MNAKWNYRLGLLLVTLSAIAWSSGGFFVRLIPLDAFTQLQWRGFFGFLGMAVFLGFRDGRRAVTDLQFLGWAGAAYVLFGALAMFCFINSLTYTSVAHNSIIYATVPLVTAVLAWFLIREKPGKSALLAALASFGGVALMVSTGEGGGQLLGDGLAFLMTLFTALMIVLGRRHLKIPLLQATALSALGSSLLAVPFAQHTLPEPEVLWHLFVFAIFTQTFGLAAFALGSRLIPSMETALIGALDGPLAPLWVLVAFSETPAQATIIGGTIVLVSITTHIVWSSRDVR
jgi:drug/metabolite transporter (DMT)-like permease